MNRKIDVLKLVMAQKLQILVAKSNLKFIKQLK
jgi:hypothetical protein